MRQSRYLPHRASANLANAVRFAIEVGRPLNWFVTINYGLTSCEPEAMSSAFELLRDNHFVPWFKRYRTSRPHTRGPTAYVWVAEGRPGHHGVHWLVHLPPQLKKPFAENMRRWLERTAGPILDDKAIHIRPAETPQGATLYMLKGLDHRHAKRFRVDPKWQGVVFGKRCGVSASLGPAAIRRHRGRHTTGPARALAKGNAKVT